MFGLGTCIRVPRIDLQVDDGLAFQVINFDPLNDRIMECCCWPTKEVVEVHAEGPLTRGCSSGGCSELTG